jgi:hydroxymethylpyrimidine/phosphomethylpyrimidine kinase
MGQDALWLVSHLFMELIVAAIAANIALGFDMITAVEKAIDYVQGAILHSYSMGKGNGPLNHLFRQRNLPFTPYIPVFSVSNVSGKFYDYLLKHPRIKPVWHEYTRIPSFRCL